MAPQSRAASTTPVTLTSEALTAIGGTYCKGAPADFTWVATDEPHRTRRQQILAAHPEVKTLFGPEPLTAPIAICLVLFSLATAWYFPIRNYLDPAGAAAPLFENPMFSFLPTRGTLFYHFTAFAIGGTIINALFLAIHEITHCLAFPKVAHNFWLAMACNFPILIPYAMTFKGYHAIHHQYQGIDGYDTDIPTITEAKILTAAGIFGKFFFLFFQILFYALRSMFIRALPYNRMMGQAIVVQVVFDIVFFSARYATLDPALGNVPATSTLLTTVTGLVGFAPSMRFEATAATALWMLLSIFYAGCFHPVSGHFISEHFEFVSGFETYSYYGPLNWLAWNVGYHNEHHDFPNIPWSRLPALRRMAPEFYDNLPQTASWPGTLWDFLTKPVNCWSRIKRPQSLIKTRNKNLD